MKRTIAYLIRHGELENPDQIIYWRTFDLPLSQEGVRQIHSLADKIKKRNEFPVSIYSSPLRRTVQTAEILSKRFNAVPVVKDDGLIESDSSGIDGQPLARLEEFYYDQDQALLQKKYRFEDFSSVIQRMTLTLNDFYIKNTGSTFFLVSHGDPLALLFWKLLNPKAFAVPLRVQWEKNYLEKGESWRIVFGADGFEGYDHITLSP